MHLSKRLYRSSRDRMLAGVAGGVAEYIQVDPSLIRLLLVLALLCTGPLAALLYVLSAAIIPSEPETTWV
jgi:phage shock protein C